MALIKLNNRSSEDTAIHGRRNLIINGGFDVWQRGTSLSITTSNFRIADQWVTYPGSSSSGTASRQSFTLGQTDVPGQPNYYLRMDMTGAASSAPNIQHRIEDVRTAAGQEVTLSFYAKCGSGTVVVDPIIRQYFGTGGSPSSSVDISPNDITLTTSWQRFTRTFTMGSLSGKTLGTDNMHQIQIRLQLPTSATYTVDIAQVQFETGDTATPFEHRSFGEELALCQRYFCKSYDYDIAPGASLSVNNLNGATATAGQTTSANRPFWAGGPFPVNMRTAPTITLYNVDGTSGKITGGSFASRDGTAVNVGERNFNVYNNSGATADEDHYCIYTASAEL